MRFATGLRRSAFDRADVRWSENRRRAAARLRDACRDSSRQPWSPCSG